MTFPTLDQVRNPAFKANAEQLIREMLTNQLHLNTTAYSQEWLAKGKTREFNYPVAASQEIAEFINSFWQPWWSKSEQDMANCRIEIVDALHFLLSEAIIQYDDNGGIDAAAFAITEDFISAMEFSNLPIQSPDTLEMARMLQASINADLDTVFIDLFQLSYSIGFDIDKLHALYMGKSILNKFRQDNGYKQGNYKKKWDGVNEDNHFLSEWVATQDEGLTGDQVYNFLKTKYDTYK